MWVTVEYWNISMALQAAERFLQVGTCHITQQEAKTAGRLSGRGSLRVLGGGVRDEVKDTTVSERDCILLKSQTQGGRAKTFNTAEEAACTITDDWLKNLLAHMMRIFFPSSI